MDQDQIETEEEVVILACFRTLRKVVLSDEPLLRSSLKEQDVCKLAELQCVDWGREENLRQTIPCTVVPTWKGRAIVYERLYSSLLFKNVDKIAARYPDVGYETVDSDPKSEIHADVLAAKQILLHFHEYDWNTLAQAHVTLNNSEIPQSYEERGELNGNAYYYAREVYPVLGITIHHDGEKITNVESHK